MNIRKIVGISAILTILSSLASAADYFPACENDTGIDLWVCYLVEIMPVLIVVGLGLIIFIIIFAAFKSLQKP